MCVTLVQNATFLIAASSSGAAVPKSEGAAMDSILAFLVTCSTLSCKTLTFEVSWAWPAGSPRFRPKSYYPSWKPGGAAKWL